jgi:hypothetical protein
MRFMSIIKGPEVEGEIPPELMEAIGKLGEEEFKNGTLIDTGGLAPTVARTRIRINDGSITVTDGPFTEAKEVIGGYAIMEHPSKEAAVKAAVDFMELHLKYWPGWNGEAEIGPVFGPNDEGPHA